MKRNAVLLTSLLLIVASLSSTQVRSTLANGSPEKLFYVLVDSEIYSGVESSVSQYATDLQNEGYSVSVHNVSTNSPEEVRALLSSALPYGLVGAFFVGDIPEVMYELDYEYNHEEFPIDLFYTDLDGVWTDSDSDNIYDVHEGDVGPEIFIGRLKASNIDGNETSMINSYFEKVHNYRIGTLLLPQRALVYVDDEFTSYADSLEASVKLAYDETTLVKDETTTNATDYKQRLTQEIGYECVQLFCHGSPGGHSLLVPGIGYETVSSQDYRTLDLKGGFYQFISCSIARYTVGNNLASTIVLTTSHGLLVIGSTKILYFSGGISSGTFYDCLAQGKNVGLSFQQSVGWTNPAYSYGYTIIGDPTLRVTAVRNADTGFGYLTIQGAINAAEPGNTIYVRPGIYHENLVVNKTLTIVGEGVTSTVIDGNGSGNAVTLQADNINLNGFAIQNGTKGIDSEYSDNAYISNNTLLNNDYGIYLDNSNNNTIIANTVHNNDFGVYLDNSHNNSIEANVVTHNAYESTHAGIQLKSSQHTYVSGNIVSNNTAYGIYIWQSPSTTIANNEILWNVRGLHLQDSETSEYNCTVYHNSFVNNSMTQASRYGNPLYPSTWDDGYPSGGNHWSDYDGKDRDGDGIGDSHYKIDGQNKDNYPFINPVVFNITVANVTTCKTIVGQGYTMHFNTTVQNQESFAKAFCVMFYVNSTITGSRTTILKSGEYKTLTFVWNTTGFSYGNYPVSAATGTYANVFNTLEDGTVLVTIPGDVNGDRSVNSLDQTLVSNVYWWPSSFGTYNPNADINDDGATNSLEMGIIYAHWGQHWNAHDIAVTSILTCKTIVGQNYPIHINVTVENQGDYTETFNLTVYANSTVIGTQTVTLVSETSTVVTFTWNTTGIPYGNYIISASAEILPSEIDTANNSLTGNALLVTIPGDVNGDRTVNSLDIGVVNAHWTGVGPYDPNVDVNHDGLINSLEIGIINAHWGQSW